MGQSNNKEAAAAVDIEASSEYAELIDRCLDYARTKLESNLDGMQTTLQKLKGETIDLLWPGAGYNSVACGGVYEVLVLLEQQGWLQIGNIMGASGGACSAILALAAGTRGLLRSYLRYVHDGGPKLKEGFKASSLWREIYASVIEDDEAFERVRRRGYCAVAAGFHIFQWKNTVLSNFDSRESCVQAYVASGEASAFAAVAGHKINDTVGYAGDGGGVMHFPGGDDRLVLYYSSFHDSATTCTKQSVEELFCIGVDQIIDALLSPELQCRPCSKGNGGIAIVRPSGLQALKQEWKIGFSIRNAATFHDMTTLQTTPHSL